MMSVCFTWFPFGGLGEPKFSNYWGMNLEFTNYSNIFGLFLSFLRFIFFELFYQKIIIY